jgi:hypothetical protein
MNQKLNKRKNNLKFITNRNSCIKKFMPTFTAFASQFPEKNFFLTSLKGKERIDNSF